MMNIVAKIEINPLSTEVGVLITNYAVRSCKIHNPISECGLNYDFFTVKSMLGEKIKYLGATVLSRTDLVEIKSNNTFVFSFDMINEYMITAPIEHSVEYMVECIGDGSFTSNKGTILGDVIQEKVAHKVMLYPEERFEGYSTNVTGIYQSGYKFIGTNDQSLIDETVVATNQLTRTLNSISSLHDENKLINYYNKFICHANDGNIYYNYIQDIYTKSLSYLENTLEYSFNGSRCKSGTFAYVYAASPIKILYLCDEYIKSQTTPDIHKPYDTKFGTVIHEILHKVSKGEIHDYSYGVQACFSNIETKSCDDTLKCFVQQAGVFKPGSNCAATGNHSNPNTNVYNADCMEFLVESVYYDNSIEANQSEISWNNYAMIATAGAMGLIGVAYYYFQGQHN